MGAGVRTRARIRQKKHERVKRQASERVRSALSSDQRRILELSEEGYDPGEVARELALSADYVSHFMAGLIQKLSGEGLIPSPDWRNALLWYASEDAFPFGS
jgi:DNA-binding NarL/FixJ family response regulator